MREKMGTIPRYGDGVARNHKRGGEDGWPNLSKDKNKG